MALAANDRLRFSVALSSTGSRSLIQHSAAAIQTFLGRAAVGSKGELVLSATYRAALDFGPDCQLPSAADTRSYVAVFAPQGLTACRLVRDTARFEPLGLAATESASVVVGGVSTRALDFGAQASAPAPNGSRAFATELAL